jgi:hypothetical protein
MRREKTVSDTDREVADEIEALKSSGNPVTMKDVDELIARKEREHALEMKYNLDFTAEPGKVWSDDELKAVEASLAQVPAEMWDGELKLREVRRGAADTDGDNAINDPNDGGVITIFDNGAKTTADEARDHMDPMFEAQYGPKSSHLERVMTHELGHSAHNADLSQLDLYRDATAWIPGAQHAEYFAQDYKNALLNPEAHAKASLDDPQAELLKAQADLIANPTDPAKAEALSQAVTKVTTWSMMYYHMRDDVLHGDQAEEAGVARLRELEASEEEIARYREKAKRLSTPDQIERMGEDEFGL